MLVLLAKVNSQEVQITNLNKNPGILPYKLGPARIKTKTHTFIHYYDLEPIRNEINILKEEYKNITETIRSKLSNPQIEELENFDRALWFQLNAVEQKFNSLMPNIRVKRGLIDGLGSIIKSITGNLDANDAQHYDQAIKELESNNVEIVQKLNKEISMTTQIIDNFNISLTGIQHNQRVIASSIDKLNSQVQNILFDFADYLKIRNILDQLNLTLNLILQLLLDIENSVTFARLNVYHSSILKINEVESILNTVLKYYSINELMFPNLSRDLHNYYDILNIEAYYSNSKVVFVIHFPIMHPETFTHYRLYSIPTENKTILVPPNTYLVMNEESYQYASSPCVKLHSEYYCPDEHLIHGNRQENCIFNLLLLSATPSNCAYTSVQITKSIIEQIDEANYIGIFSQSTKIQTTCERSDFTTLKGTYLIVLPAGCSFRTNESNFINVQEIIDGQPMLLPEIIIPPGATTEKILEIQLEDINLDKIHELQKGQHAIDLAQLTSNHRSITNHIISYILIALIAIVITSYLILKFIKRKQGQLKTSSSEEQPQVQPQVHPQVQPRSFFNP